MLDWTDGSPPEFFGKDKALIVVELPSRFSGVNVVSYRCVSWLGESWSDREVFRARRWMTIPLPREPQGVVIKPGNSRVGRIADFSEGSKQE